jgi:hypothetical protein
MRTLWRSAGTAALMLGAPAACTSILGDFAIGPAGTNDAGPGTDGSTGNDGESADVSPDRSAASADVGPDHSAASGDAGDGAPHDAASELPATPAPGKPGFDLTSGGNSSNSSNYKLIGAVGEAPGGYVIGRSTHYTLKGGVVAETQ